jgi:hypothetical protein
MQVFTVTTMSRRFGSTIVFVWFAEHNWVPTAAVAGSASPTLSPAATSANVTAAAAALGIDLMDSLLPIR